MEENLLIDKLRTYISRYGLNELDREKLSTVGIDSDTLTIKYTSMEDIAKTVLDHERLCFEQIFDNHSFDGWNAIDIILMVCSEINKHFFNISPSYTFKLAEAYPEIFSQHTKMRSDYIYSKIKWNIEKGMKQGMYRADISSEMIARIYISHLNDIQNPEIYPEGYTFATVFTNMIDNVIKSITNEDGHSYYKYRKQLYSVLNFQ